MNPDLVRSPCHRPRFDQSSIAAALLRMSLKPLKDFEARLRRFPVFVIHHRAMLVSYIGAQRMFGSSLAPLWIPLYDRAIHLFCLMVLELHVERAMGLGIACEDHHAAGTLIQSMGNPYFSVFL